MYINVQLIQLHFSLRKDIMNHRDINLISFFNNSIIFFIINIYSDEQQTALKYLKNIEVNIHNILIMTGALIMIGILLIPIIQYTVMFS